MKKLLAIVGLSILTILTYSQTPSFISNELDNYIKKGMSDWQVPGLSITIIKDGKVVLTKGYGVKDIETKEPVDEHTLFMIASNSKLFTGTALAQLEYNKKLSLDDKIIKYFKNYRLYDSISTQIVSIRDLLSHRIGTKTFQGDFTFWNSKLSRGAIIERMQLLKPVGIFRQDYGYCNSCYLTAGEIIPLVSGKPWEVYVYDSVFMPLDMNNTHALSQGISERKNVAVPYTTSFTNKLQKVPYDQWDNLGPAASIVSNVHDLSKWLTLQLDSGKYNGKQAIAWPVLQKTRDVNIVTGSRKSSLYPIHFRGYGLGLFSADYNGRQIYWHTGGAAGMVSNVCFVPEEKLGIAILTNNDNQSFFEALRYQILDAYLQVPFINRSQQQLPFFTKEMRTTVDSISNWKSKIILNLTPSLPLDAYVGKYRNDLYGVMTIQKKDNHLLLKFNSHNNLTATLKYMGNENWLLEYNNIEYGIFKTGFQVEKGEITAVSIKTNDYVEYDPYIFIKEK